MLQAEMYPEWLTNTLIDRKIAFLLQDKTQSNNQAELHSVDQALIAEICDEVPLS